MQIEKDRVAAFHYILSNGGPAPLEDSAARGTPQWYLHGRGQIVPGLERELEGKRAGDRFSVSVLPQDAYGMRQPGQLVRVPLKKLKDVKPLKVGTLLQMNTPEGPKIGTVRKIGMTVADIDLNHPMAGQTLHFEVEVVEVREASSEELQHGHAHPPGMDAH